MRFTEEQINELFKLKDTLTNKLEKNINENKMLKKNLEIIDVIIKEGSFIKASNLVQSSKNNKNEYYISINNNNVDIAKALVDQNKISISLEKNISINSSVPPLKSFFINRIITKMKKEDLIEVKNKLIKNDEIINCDIIGNNSILQSIIITNYRKKERINEIINTITWSLSRMLENSK